MKREIVRLWERLDPRILAIFTLITLMSFYGFRFIGHSQVYYVIAPYAVISIHLLLLCGLQTHEEREGPAASFYRSLPRDHAAAYDARALFYLGLALYYELVVLLGVVLKLGGDGITPVYRLLPEAIALPFAVVLYKLWHLHHNRGRWFRLFFTPLATFTPALLVGVAGFFLIRNTFSIATVEYLPPRLVPIEIECAIAAFIVVPGAILYWRVRGKQPGVEGSGA